MLAWDHTARGRTRATESSQARRCRPVALGTATPWEARGPRASGCPGPCAPSWLAPLKAHSPHRLSDAPRPPGRRASPPGHQSIHLRVWTRLPLLQAALRPPREGHDPGVHGGGAGRGPCLTHTPTRGARATPQFPGVAAQRGAASSWRHTEWISMFIKPWIIEEHSGAVFHLYESMSRELHSTFALLLTVYKDGANQRHPMYMQSRPSCNK